MKYSKRDREDAILICQIAASGGVWVGDLDEHGARNGMPGWQSFTHDGIATALDISSDVPRVLSIQAWDAVERELNDGTHTDAVRVRRRVPQAEGLAPLHGDDASAGGVAEAVARVAARRSRWPRAAIQGCDPARGCPRRPVMTPLFWFLLGGAFVGVVLRALARREPAARALAEDTRRTARATRDTLAKQRTDEGGGS